MMAANTVKVTPAAAHDFSIDLLTCAGVSREHASLVADSLVLADLRGVDTHGINRLPGYLARIKTGALNSKPALKFVDKTLVMAHLDAQNTLGFIAGCAAIDKGVAMAEKSGVGIVGVKNSGHYGMAATYLLRAIEKGYAAFAFTNASKAMPAWGSKETLLGTSPFAVGLPGGKAGDFVLDMAPTVVARGKIRKAVRRGEQIPDTWAIDSEGRPTTDPSAAMEGNLLPIGGPKGSGLSMMMDIFGGLLTGASFGGDVYDQYKVLDKPQGVGHWFMVFKPDMFLDSKEEYMERMDTLFERVRSSDKAAGVQRIFTPGEIEHLKKEQQEDGVTFTRSEVDELHRVASEWGCTAKLTTEEAMTQKRNYKLPRGAWDSHIHVVDEEKFPFHPDYPYRPKKADLDDLLRFEGSLGIDHVCIVSMSVYWEDNACLLDGLRRLDGKGRAVACIDPKTVTDAEMDEMHSLGVRAVRVNIKTIERKMEKDDFIKLLHAYAEKIRSRKWVLQIYVGISQLPIIADVIGGLGVEVVIDHVGHPDHYTLITEQPGYSEMMDLLKNKQIWVKLSGTYRFPDMPGLADYVKEMLRIAPTQIVWASDWPHSGGVEENPNGDRHIHQDYRKVDDPGFVRQCIDWCEGDETLIRQIFVDNPRRLWQYDGPIAAS